MSRSNERLRFAVIRLPTCLLPVKNPRQRILLGQRHSLLAICHERTSCAPGPLTDVAGCCVPSHAEMGSERPDLVAPAHVEHSTAIEQHVKLATVNPFAIALPNFDGDTKLANTSTKRVDVADGFELGHRLRAGRTSTSAARRCRSLQRHCTKYKIRTSAPARTDLSVRSS